MVPSRPDAGSSGPRPNASWRRRPPGGRDPWRQTRPRKRPRPARGSAPTRPLSPCVRFSPPADLLAEEGDGFGSGPRSECRRLGVSCRPQYPGLCSQPWEKILRQRGKTGGPDGSRFQHAAGVCLCRACRARDTAIWSSVPPSARSPLEVLDMILVLAFLSVALVVGLGLTLAPGTVPRSRTPFAVAHRLRTQPGRNAGRHHVVDS